MTVRRVRRIIRKVDPWTVLKVATVLNAIIGLVWVLGVWVAWSIAVQRGIPDAFVEIFARLTIVFTPDGELYFRVVVMFAIVWAITATAAMTLGAVLYNLISDLVGGVELIMLEEVPDLSKTTEPAMPRPVLHVPPSEPIPVEMASEETAEHTS
ncbi:MAG: DUF3566 domain-containing protein [Actinomycetota bacterium]